MYLAIIRVLLAVGSIFPSLCVQSELLHTAKDSNDGESTLDRTINERQHWNHYHCRVTIRLATESDGWTEEAQDVLWELSRDGIIGKKVRHAPTHLGMLTVVHGDLGVGTALHFTAKDGTGLPVSVLDCSDSSRIAPDLRSFGLQPESAGLFGPVRNAVDLHKLGTLISSEEVKLGGNAYQRVVFQQSDGAELAYWIDTSQGNSPVRCMRSLRGVVQTSDCLYLSKDGHWLPRSVEYTRTEQGKVMHREIATVEYLSFNEPLPANVFSPESLNIPLGTAVNWEAENVEPPGPRGSLYWKGDGIGLVDSLPKFSSFRYSTDPTSQVATSDRNSLILLNVLLLAIFAVWHAAKHIWGKPK